MSAGQAQLKRTGRTGSLTADQSQWEAIYQVITDNVNDGPATVVFAPGMPLINSIYSLGTEIDFGAHVTSIVPTQNTDNPKVWEVRVVWSTININPARNNTNPTLEPNIIRWRMEAYNEPIERDRNGNLIQTVNHEWFNPQPEITRYRPVANIEKNFQVFNDSLMFTYVGSVNSDTWLGGAAEYWLCRDLRVEPKYERGFSYKRVIGEFVYNRDTWSLVIAHKGTLYKKNSSSTQFTFDPGRPLVHLTTDGVKSSTHVSNLTFNILPSNPFNALNIL